MVTRISLRAFQHPITLLSVGLLLLNDHFLKAQYPSFITGKLSDFAGLFFFPFLLAALLGLLPDRLRLPPRHSALIAFSLTAAGFSLIKTVPVINSLASGAMCSLTGRPTGYVMDAGDLLALLVLLPAWRLWERLENNSPPRPPTPGAYLALGVAFLAALATSPCPPDTRITRLVYYDNMLYANTSLEGSGYNSGVLKSTDKTWRHWEAVKPADRSEEFKKLIFQPAKLPLTVCEPQNLQSCYRVDGLEQIEASSDGSQTWNVTWKTPDGRIEFMNRYLSSKILACKRKVDPGPYDLVIVPDEQGKPVVIAASGNEGIVAGSAEKGWERIQVMNASPTPYSEIKIETLFFILALENFIFFSTALVLLWGLSIASWSTILRKAKSPDAPPKSGVRRPLLWCAAVLAALVVLLSLLITTGTGVIILAIPLGICISLVGLFFAWRSVIHSALDQRLAAQAGYASGLAALGVFPLGWSVFILWTAGVIAKYSPALVIAILLGGASIICGIVVVVMILRKMCAAAREKRI